MFADVSFGAALGVALILLIALVPRLYGMVRGIVRGAGGMRRDAPRKRRSEGEEAIVSYLRAHFDP